MQYRCVVNIDGLLGVSLYVCVGGGGGVRCARPSYSLLLHVFFVLFFKSLLLNIFRNSPGLPNVTE